MKPCEKNRKLIAWLAMDALDAQPASELRDHLAHCEGCRSYLAEISNVKEGLASAAPDSNLEASANFHRAVAKKLQAAKPVPSIDNLSSWLRTSILNWRIALPTLAAVVIALALVIPPRRQSIAPLPVPPIANVVSPRSSESDLSPTIANYQMAANQSLDKLSDLLTEQGNKSLPPAPIYTASGRDLANTP